MDRALCFMRRARPRAGRVRTRWSARSSCRRDGVVVGQGYHERAGEPHAEVHALDDGRRRGRAAATLYCTLEPCCHQGRTGPCAPRIVDAGIARVVAAVEDPESAACAAAASRICATHGVDVEVGLGATSAVRLNQPFFTLMREGRPFVILKAAMSLDGCIAAAPGARTPLTSAAANRHAHASGPRVDAIGVGVGTILADDPLLTARGVYRERPLTASSSTGGCGRRRPRACSRHARPALSSS